ncbi:MAG: MbnP family protein [Bacteroidia bacterium]
MKKIFISVISLAVLLGGCKKDSETEPTPLTPNSFTITISHSVDAQSLYFDSLMYTNEAGYNYSVSRVWYYLSNLKLIKSDSSEIKISDYLFVDAAQSSTCKMNLSSVPEGSYIGIAYSIGLDSSTNQTGALPATVENLQMEWPVPMGGGYHFLKFEGSFIDSSLSYGFTMHIGTNTYLVNGKAWRNFSIGSGNNQINLAMNLNEWFRNPMVYDFDMDGNYSMGNMMAMDKLMKNGADVFNIVP